MKNSLEGLIMSKYFINQNKYRTRWKKKNRISAQDTLYPNNRISKNIRGEIIIKEIIKGNLPELKDTNFQIKRAQQVANSQMKIDPHHVKLLFKTNLEHWKEREDPNSFQKEYEDGHIQRIRNQNSIGLFK